MLYHLCEALRVAGILLNAYLPSTAPKMMDQLGLDASALDLSKTVYGAQETYTVHKGDALFPRIDVAKEIAHLKEEDEKRKAAAEAANKAKAEAEAMEKAGEGIANQRKAIALGIKDSLETIQETGVGNDEANQLFMFTQWTEMMNEFAKSGKSATVVLPSDYKQASSMFEQMLCASEATRQGSVPPVDPQQ